jgi:hypothetical protein
MHLHVFKKDYWKGQRLLLLAFLLVHTIVSFYYISQQNITFDEPQYIEYAKHWLHGKPERVEPLDDSKSPIVAICWVPRIVRQTINPHYHLNDYGRKDQEEGRYMMILFSFFTALYVFKWCRDLYGKKGWILPLLLLLFDPLYLAYTTIITTDLACGAFLVAILYHSRRYLLYAHRKDFYLTALFTGLGIVTKQNMLFVVLLLPILSIVHFVLSSSSGNKILAKGIITDVLLFGIMIVLVINIMYYFHRSFIPFGNYTFESHTLQNLQRNLSFLHRVPVPLPHAYVQSVDMIKAHADIGAGKPNSTYNGVYLFGQLKLEGKFWYYYLVMLWYKMPIGTMLLVSASIPLFIKRFRTKAFAEKYQFLIIPIAFYLIVLSFFNQFQTGIRHLLLVFPLLFIGLGYLFRCLKNAPSTYKILTGVAIAYTFISVAFYYPYLIPYTNEFITNKKTLYRKIYDSSVDYGQSDSSLNSFIAKHPQYKKASPVPDTGKYAVLMGQVINTYFREANPYRWYQRFEPTGQSKFVILTFDIKEDDLVKAGLKGGRR